MIQTRQQSSKQQQSPTATPLNSTHLHTPQIGTSQLPLIIAAAQSTTNMPRHAHSRPLTPENTHTPMPLPTHGTMTPFSHSPAVARSKPHFTSSHISSHHTSMPFTRSNCLSSGCSSALPTPFLPPPNKTGWSHTPSMHWYYAVVSTAML